VNTNVTTCEQTLTKIKIERMTYHEGRIVTSNALPVVRKENSNNNYYYRRRNTHVLVYFHINYSWPTYLNIFCMRALEPCVKLYSAN